MELCPVCNALTKVEESCVICQADLLDYGKLSDFLDPYGHYHDLNTIQSTHHQGERDICSHLLYCETCGHEQVIFIHEQRWQAF